MSANAVEPDSNVWNLLAANRLSHRCSFWIYRGVVSSQPVALHQDSYGTYTSHTSPSTHKYPHKQTLASDYSYMTLNQLQQALNLSFDTLLIDCEGCIDGLFASTIGYNRHSQVFTSNTPSSIQNNQQSLPPTALKEIASALAKIHTIILEADRPSTHERCNIQAMTTRTSTNQDSSSAATSTCVDYKRWHRIFLRSGFRLIETVSDHAYPWIYHYVYHRKV